MTDHERYMALVDSLADNLGRPHGWKKHVADRLGISQSLLSRLLAGTRQASPALLRRAEERIGVDLRGSGGDYWRRRCLLAEAELERLRGGQ